uniref:RRM domain-containing protein n=1 Tax=Plectus sambesii TaxID=2011161 RepID=A0A914UPP4_9BILA
MTEEALIHNTTTSTTTTTEMNGVKRDFDDASWSNSQDDASQSPPVGNNGNASAIKRDTRTGAGSDAAVTSVKQPPVALVDDDDDDTDYIIVSDREDGHGSKLELPAEPDGTLTISTLAHSFPDAIGLKYRNPTTGIFRALGVDSAGVRILAPKGGWRNREFVVIFRPKESAAPAVAPPYVTTNTIGGGESAVAPKRRLDDETGREGDSVASMSKSQRVDEYESPSVVRKTCDLVVLNLPFKTTSEGLKAYFEKFGEVVVAEIKTDFRTGQPKGFGFVQMCEWDAQCKVLEQYEHFIDGRMTQVKIPNSRGREHDGQPSPSHHRAPAPPPAFVPEPRSSEGICTKMYVGRVPVNFSQEDIRSFFDKEAKKFGHHAQVEHVLIPKPHRGFAFVTFNDPEVTKKIIRISDFVINGVSVCVSAASPKEQQQNQPPSQSQGPPPSGSYGYGYGYAGRGPPREAPGYGPRDDQPWNGSGWSGHPGESAGYGQPGGYAGYGSGYGAYGQGRGGGPPQPTAANAASDNNLHAAWSAFWATLQGQPGQSGGGQNAQSAMQSWQWAAAMGQNPAGQQPATPDSAQPQSAAGTWPGKS